MFFKKRTKEICCEKLYVSISNLTILQHFPLLLQLASEGLAFGELIYQHIFRPSQYKLHVTV